MLAGAAAGSNWTCTASCNLQAIGDAVLPFERVRRRALHPNQSLEPLLRGDPVEAMEAAKQIISQKLLADPASLEAILVDRKSRKWSRIAAIYSLGFLGGPGSPAYPVRPQGVDRGQSARCAWQYRRDPGGARHRRDTESSPSLRKSCIYALEEIDDPRARAALKPVRPGAPDPA
jgi:hypothetical protein